ncbi:hypothetical protein [Ilumatobacter nonamiensis]|uniref:hypothetical protein n=1 Tax=Ilumatobacter nonamiensis TaxID=467093 RepID=UPI0003458ABA|nr:hypothetical protein [Ilumatobacter nonamiensis]
MSDRSLSTETTSGSGRRRSIATTAAGLALAAVLAACAANADTTDDAASDASTEPTVSVDSTPAPSTEASTTVAPTSVGPAGLSFANDVMPIIEDNCAACHTQNGPGAAHLRLETAGDATGFDAEYIGAVVDVGYMPPWPAADGDVEFHGDRRLADTDRQTMVSWADAGGILDVDPATPIVATATPLPTLDGDLTLTGLPYKGDVENDEDDYRCQIYDPQLTESGYVEAFGFEPDRTEVVHHALLFHADASARQAAEDVEAASDDIGWSCSGLAGFGAPGTVDQVMSWAPGQQATVFPDGVGIPVEPGDFFVVQIHYHYEPEWNDLPPDESRLVVDLADQETIDAAAGELDPITLTLYLGPAEIPCSTDETGPLCDREAARAQLIEEQGPFAGFVGDGLMASCGATVEDFAGMTDGVASSSCDHRATPGTILSVWGHEHEIGSSFTMTLNPDTPDERVLLDIPRWDFDWQLNYEPVEEIVLTSDDVIRVECSWDRAKIPADAEPRYVMWSEGTADEMCYSQIITRPTS